MESGGCVDHDESHGTIIGIPQLYSEPLFRI